MKMWGGRFTKEQSEVMKQFNDSFRFDQRLYEVDIRGSKTYADALAYAGLLTKDENAQIQIGLEQVRQEFAGGVFQAQTEDEDIHTAVERRLRELIGPPAGKLHTGRSRNDQVALDLRLYVLEQIERFLDLIAHLQRQLVAQSEAHFGIIMPGFTHLQPAQPILFSHWLMSFFWMFERDKDRLLDVRKRTAVSPLGAGALAGNPFGIDRYMLSDSLGMDQVSNNSLDAVSDRDFSAEFLFVLSLSAVHISHLAEDLILFCNPALGFLQIGEAYSTGSSLMPQKRNPDSMELARGKAGRVIAALMNLLVVLKGLPSTYNKDLQEDKEPLFDAVDNFSLTLSVVGGVIESLTVFPENMAAQLNEGMLATDMAEYLVRRGLPFREAHHVVGEVIRYAEAHNLSLSDVPLSALKKITPQFEEDVVQVFEYKQSVNRKTSIGGTAPQAVAEQIELAKKKLGSFAAK
ncbi:MAG TPA: argininosuccinate lyase [Anaerolineales bacterium]|nr:argininosuccinate lyase [Anaerolineales bacterium]